jgi:hypothetical protein
MEDTDGFVLNATGLFLQTLRNVLVIILFGLRQYLPAVKILIVKR